MDLKQIKELMASMAKSGIKRLSFKQGDVEIQLEKEEENTPRATSHFFMKGDPETLPALSAPSMVTHTPPEAEQMDVVTFITSPMVGTFYISSSSDEAPFVKIGDSVDKDTVVCIVEAMKVMNEVKAGQKGIIVEVMAQSGHPIEFGTRLFKVRPHEGN